MLNLPISLSLPLNLRELSQRTYMAFNKGVNEEIHRADRGFLARKISLFFYAYMHNGH